MPRAFLIKKKKCGLGLGFGVVVNDENVFGGQMKCGDEENDINMFPKTKKRKSYEAMATRIKNEIKVFSDKQVEYDSGSDSGCRSVSPITMKSFPEPALPLHGHLDYRLAPHPHHLLSADSSPAVLDPLKLRSAAVQWMRPFLNQYFPINFPSYPYHPQQQLSPEAACQFYGSNASPLCPSKAQPPSPNYPSPNLAYTPPPGVDYDERRVAPPLTPSRAPSSSPSPSSWSVIERCSSAKSSDTGDESLQELNEMSVKRGSRTADTSGGARYQCPDCQKSYSTFSGLSKHQQFHCTTTNKRSFSCKYCEKVYMSLGALKMHIRTHTLPCKCELCGKAFSRPWLLQGHIRTHTGEKPFSCTHCNRAFADRSNLRAHLQTHSDVKKYSCKVCAKTFSRMSLLLKHEDGNCCNSNTHQFP